MTDETRRLRNALGCFTTGVCVVTAATERGPVGLTINSFASVSLEPPLVLWSLDRASDRADVFQSVERFAINVLSEDMRELSSKLARKGAYGVPEEALDGQAGDVPVLDGTLARFVCTVEARHDGGDHVIVVGRVVSFAYAERGHPLIYYRGHYRALAEV